MKCPNCKKEMEQGFLKIFGFGFLNRIHWTRENKSMYPLKLGVDYVHPKGEIGSRCPKCRMIVYNY